MVNRFLTTPQSVADAVRSARIERGLSQAALAVQAGVGRRFVVDLESGHPRAELAKVLAVLGVLEIHALALPAPKITKRPEDVDLHDVVRRFG